MVMVGIRIEIFPMYVSLMKVFDRTFNLWYILCSEAPHNVVVTSSVDLNVASLNDNVSLMCNNSGGPSNAYEWMKDGMIIDGEVDNTLALNKVTASSGGSYTCTVSNAAGNDSASITLYVAPYIVTPLDEQSLTASGSNVNINCDAAGFPSPIVNWVDMTNMEVSNTSLLEFSPVMFGDEGLYRCVATTEIDGMNFTATDETILVGRYNTTILNPHTCAYYTFELYTVNQKEGSGCHGLVMY